MKNENIQALIENSIEKLESIKKIEKQKYLMNFGEFSIQYDFTLN